MKFLTNGETLDCVHQDHLLKVYDDHSLVLLDVVSVVPMTRTDGVLLNIRDGCLLLCSLLASSPANGWTTT